MKIIVSAGGRFHAINLASKLAQHGHLEHLFTFSFTNNDRTLIPPKNVTQVWLCRFLDQVFERCRLGRVIDKTLFNFYKDTLFDWCVARQLGSFSFLPTMQPERHPREGGDPDKLKTKVRDESLDPVLQRDDKTFSLDNHIDLFVVWANYGLRSIPQAKKRGALVIVESGSAHIKEQAELLTSEYQKYGLCQNPVHPKTIARMTKEYALADYIMVPSTFVYNSFLKHGIPAEKLLTVPCGMNLEAFLRARILRQAQDERLGKYFQDTPILSAHGEPVEPDERFRVIFVGLLCLRKGVH